MTDTPKTLGRQTAITAFTAYLESLLPEHLEILDITNPFDLFNIEGFETKSEWSLSLEMAFYALATVKRNHIPHKKETI